MTVTVTVQDERSQAEFLAACMAQRPAVLRYVRATTRCHHDADDLVQDVIMQAMTADQRPDAPALKPWLLRIARNRVAEFYRRKVIERRGAEKLRAQRERNGGFSAEDALLGSDFNSAVREAIDALSDIEREALTLKYSRFYSNIEIAGMLQLTPGNLGVILCRALKTVRQTLKEHGHELE